MTVQGHKRTTVSVFPNVCLEPLFRHSGGALPVAASSQKQTISTQLPNV